jgi:hypothetical protein
VRSSLSLASAWQWRKLSGRSPVQQSRTPVYSPPVVKEHRHLPHRLVSIINRENRSIKNPDGTQPYLRTHADGKWNDNLLAQRECDGTCKLVA